MNEYFDPVYGRGGSLFACLSFILSIISKLTRQMHIDTPEALNTDCPTDTDVCQKSRLTNSDVGFCVMYNCKLDSLNLL